MLSKKLCNNKIFNKLIEQKGLIDSTSNKKFIRSNLSNNFRPNFLMDNNSTFTILNDTKKHNLGSTILTETLFLKSILTQFNTEQNTHSCFSYNYISKIEKSLSNLSDFNEISLVLVSPKKGGFNCYSNGFTGFLPKSHAQEYFRNLQRVFLLYSKKNNTRKALLPLLHLLLGCTVNFFKQLRISGFLSVVTILPTIFRNKRKLSRFKKFKKRRSSCNFVFLTTTKTKNYYDGRKKN